ncbi:hypothetical protein M378DRAFT_763834 [Amanita muscaria Koide BX008]|uniref:Hemerythrin-like domain-containing protein n=1 Tax=Amanita muscaria (strain Koide BX008) TaxID=946122 RepID=A0A0C2SZW2_AMAMK|nr:hypothetical protein M378DRAFT_763834 [Amanita muscaria Koide BX008]
MTPSSSKPCESRRFPENCEPYPVHGRNMAAVHNNILRGINAIAKHAATVEGDKIKPFLVFALTVFSTFHHHHHMEETFAFPKYEEKLGKGTFTVNYEQHEKFVPQVEQLVHYLKEVQEGKKEYDGKHIVDTIESFSDAMIQHLNEEIATLDAGRMRAAFTAKELKDIDAELLKIILATTDFYTNLPMALVCQDPDTAWFPPLPYLIKLATRWWFYRRYKESWEFGPVDLYGNPRE